MASKKQDELAPATSTRTPLQRRDLLKAALAVPAAACVDRTGADGDDGDGGQTTKPKVLVVGAGIAGLAAADMLHKTGKYSVRVVERRDRAGGRILTEYAAPGALAGKAIELGPVFLQGLANNPVAARAIELGLTVKEITDTSALIHKGTSPNPAEPIDQAEYARALNDFEAIMERTKQGQQGATDSAINGVFYDVRNELKSLSPGTLADTSDDYYPFIFRTTVDEPRGNSSTSLSWFNWNAGETLAGNSGVIVEGLSEFIKRLAGDVKVDYGEEFTVRDLEWEKSKVTVIYDDDAYDNEHREVFDAVVYAAPVLKGEVTPKMPEGKALPGDYSGGGNVSHLYLHFDTPFWEQSARWIHIKNNTGTSNGFVTFRDMTDVLGPGILLAINIGNNASTLDNLTPFDASEEAMNALRDVYPSVPLPSDSFAKVKSGWSLSENYPTWSAARFSVGDTPQEYTARAAADTGRLFFAGELTDAQYPNTLHGAYNSGLRAAQQVIDALKG